jgi:hypothetical protein
MKILKMNLAMVGLVAMSACGQQYSLRDNPVQSALIDGSNHIEGDLDPRDPVDPSPSPQPSPSVSPSPSESPSPAPSPSESPSPSPNPGDDQDGDDDSDDGDDNSLSCGKDGKKMLVCHVPQGNVANAHTICISKAGAMHGHGVLPSGQGGHGGDHAGRCSNGR